MDDVMIILGALLLAFGAGLVYVPAGVILLGMLLIVGGVFKALAKKKPA